jgi:hypothetical protein
MYLGSFLLIFRHDCPRWYLGEESAASERK